MSSAGRERSRPFGNIYAGKRVLVTGHTGFKGSWLALWLTRLGADVTGYSIDIPTEPNHFELLELKMNSVMGDILDSPKLRTTVKESQPEIVFHLAAQSLVRRSYADPVGTFATNIMGTVNVLECCRHAGSVKAIVNVTSDKCYDNKEVLAGYTEDDPMGGDDPYSASKGAVELVSHAYRHSFFHPRVFGSSHTTLLANVRAGNVVGGGDWAEDRLIPDIVKAASRDEAAVIRNPRAIRPWQHVLEPLSGYLHLAWKLLEGRAEHADNWNFGPATESSLTVGQVAEGARKYWETVRYEIQENPNAVHEAKLLNVDSSKARRQLKWRSLWDGEAMFEKTFDWYKQYYRNGTINSNDDVTAYETAAVETGVEWAPSGRMQ